MFIQVFSDLHIELWDKMPKIPAKADYLILAGDICQLNHPLFYPFLDYCSANWKKTFYIPGNHEYYSKKRNLNDLEFEYVYRIREKYNNIHYLNNTFVELNEHVNIYGTTFWTPSPFVSRYDGQMYVNDYNYIQYFKHGLDKVIDLDTVKVNEMSKESFDHLHDYLETNKKKTIIVTHFPPTRTNTSDPIYLQQRNNLTNLYFAWPDTTLLRFPLNNVVCWISGHTHWSYDFEQNGIRLIGNQFGYKYEIENIKMVKDGLFELTIS